MAGDGTVWIPVLPQMRGFAASMVEGTSAASKKASQALTDEMRKAGEAAGKAAADGLGKGVKDVEAASKRLGEARKGESDAAKAVQDAEKQLADVRKSGTASADEVTAAEKAVEDAHKGVSAASAKATSAAGDLTSAKGKLAGQSKEVAAAADKVAQAQRKEEDAAGKVTVAEQRLEDLRAKGTATAGQLAAAEATVEKTKNDLATAADRTASAEANLAGEQEKAAQSAADVAAESEKASTGIDGMGDAADGATTHMRNFGIAAGAALAAAGAALFAVGSDFHDMERGIRVGTGAVGEDLDGLIDIAHNVGRTVPADFGAIGETVADLNTRLGLTGPTLEKLSAQVLEAGRMMGDIDVNKLGGAFQAFGVTGEETTEAMDMLFQVSQATGVGIDSLADSLIKGGPSLKQFGFGIEDSAAMLGQLDKAGVRGDQVIQRMSRALVKFAEDGREPQEALQETVAEIENFISAGNSDQALMVAENLFGSRGAASFVDAVESGTMSVEDFLGATGATGDEILGLAEETRNFSEQWQLFKNDALLTIQPIAERVFEIILGGMSWIADNAIPTLQSFASWLRDNATALGIVAAAVGTVLLPALAAMVTAWVTAKVQAVASAAAQVAASWRVVAGWVAMSGAAVTESAKTVAAWVAARARVFAGWAAGAARAVGAFVMVAASAVVQAAKTAAAWVASVARTTAALAAQAAAFVVQRTVMIAGAVATGVATAAQWALNSAFLASPITWIVAGIVGLIAVIVLIATKTEWFQTAWDAVWGAVKAVFESTWNAIKAAFEAVWNFIKSNWANILAVLTGPIGIATKMIVDNWDAIKNAFGVAWNFIKDTAQAVWDWLVDTWSSFMDFFMGIVSRIGEIASTMWEPISTAAETVWGWVTRTWDSMVGFVTELPGRIKSAASGMWDGIKDAFKAALNWIIRKWNGLEFTLPEIDLGPLGSIGGWTVSVPKIPEFATGGRVSGPGTGTSDDIIARLSNGEFVVNAAATERWGPLLEAINSDQLPAFAEGGHVSADDLNQFARGVDGKPYVWGGTNWGDCSGAVSALANKATGRDPFATRFATSNQKSELEARGFKSGLGPSGSLNIGWFNGGPYGGHTAATLPNGDNFEMGGSYGGGKYGGTVGADHSQFTDHAHLPPEFFLGGDPELNGVTASGGALTLGGVDAAGGSGAASGAGADASGATKVWVTNWPTGGSSSGSVSTGGGSVGTSTVSSSATGVSSADSEGDVDFGVWGTDPAAGVVGALLEILDMDDVLSPEDIIGTAESRGIDANGQPVGQWDETEGTDGPGVVGTVVHGDVHVTDYEDFRDRQEDDTRAAAAAAGM